MLTHLIYCSWNNLWLCHIFESWKGQPIQAACLYILVIYTCIMWSLYTTQVLYQTEKINVSLYLRKYFYFRLMKDRNVQLCEKEKEKILEGANKKWVESLLVCYKGKCCRKLISFSVFIPSPTKLRRDIVTLPSVHLYFCNILVNTLESISFNGFWPNLAHTQSLRESGTLLIFKVKGQGHQVKFLGRGYATLCVALVHIFFRSSQ